MILSDFIYTVYSVKAVFQTHPAVRGNSRAGRQREGKETGQGRDARQRWWAETRGRCRGEGDSKGTGGWGQGLCVGREQEKGEREGGTGR